MPGAPTTGDQLKCAYFTRDSEKEFMVAQGGITREATPSLSSKITSDNSASLMVTPPTTEWTSVGESQ